MSKARLYDDSRCWQWRLGDEIDVFAANRREHAVVRMDAAADRRDLDSLDAPLVRADEAQQLAQRGDRGPFSRAVGFRAGLPDVGRATQRNAVVRVERHQQHAQRARTLRPRLAMEMEGFGRRRGRRGCGRLFRLARPAVGATRQRNQHLARVLEVAPPQQRGALAREAVRVVGRHAVVGDDHALRGRRAALRAPARGARLAVLGPVHDRMRVHARARVYFLLLPRALSTGYLSAFATSLRFGRGDRIDAQLVAQPDQVQQNVRDLIACRRVRLGRRGCGSALR